LYAIGWFRTYEHVHFNMLLNEEPSEIETSWTFHLKLSNHVELQSKQKLSRHESYVFAYKVSKKLSKSW
jgi:hypothetical protein